MPEDGSFRRLRGYTAASLGLPTLASFAVDPTGRFLYLSTAMGLVMHRLTTAGIVNTAPRAATAAPISAPAIAFTPDGAFAYAWVDDGERANLRAFSIDADGVFTQVAGSPFASVDRTGTGSLQVHPSGRFLLRGAPAFSSGALTGYAIDSSTGGLKPLTLSAAGPATTTGPVVFAGAARIWVQRTDGWALYAVDPQDGNLALVTPSEMFPAGTRLAADVAGKWLVVATTENNFEFAQMQLYAFAQTTNSLTAIGNPARGYASQLVADPVGELFRSRDLVLRPDATRGLEVVAISPATGAPVLAPTAAAPLSYTYALDSDAGLIRILQVDPATGALTQVSGGAAPMAGRPVALAISPRHDYVAVVSSNGVGPGTMRLFRISYPSELLAGLTSAIPVGARPTAVTISADGRQVYVSHPQGIDGFRVEMTGIVQRLAGSPFPTGYAEISTTLDPTRQVFVARPEEPVADRPAADLLQAGGVLFAATNKGAQGEVSTLGMNPDGSLYGIHTGRAACAVGLPAMGSTFSASGAGTIALGIAGNGRLVYAVNRDSNTVAGFRAVGGACLHTEGWMPPISGSPFATGARPTAMAVDPSGRYVYAAHAGGAAGQVTVFAISPISGTLTRVPGSPFPLAMVAARMWLDLAGKFLYTSDMAGHVDVLTIDRATGAPGAARSTLIGLRAHLGQDVVVTIR